jgi:hypothetical protein
MVSQIGGMVSATYILDRRKLVFRNWEVQQKLYLRTAVWLKWYLSSDVWKSGIRTEVPVILKMGWGVFQNWGIVESENRGTGIVKMGWGVSQNWGIVESENRGTGILKIGRGVPQNWGIMKMVSQNWDASLPGGAPLWFGGNLPWFQPVLNTPKQTMAPSLNTCTTNPSWTPIFIFRIFRTRRKLAPFVT